MIDLDKWQEIYITLKQHKLRTGLTAFGVFWGIFMLVVLIGVANGMEQGVKSSFSGEGNTVYMWNGNATQIPYKGFQKGRWPRITNQDIEDMRKAIPEAEVIIGINELGGWNSAQYVVRGSKGDSYITRGSYPEVPRMHGYEVAKGRFINKIDGDEKRKVAVIGSRVHELLFRPDEDPIGEQIQIGGVAFQVVGVFNVTATSDWAQRNAELVLIPNSTLQYTYNQLDRVGSIRMLPKPGIHSTYIEEKALKWIRERTHVHPDDNSVFGSYNTQKDFDKIQELFQGITILTWVVAIGTIWAGVIGVGNIMLIVVKERTREIGIRKALGATARSIVGMVLQETLVITFFAGYLGLVCGVFAVEGISLMTAEGGGQNSTFKNPEVDFKTSLVALGVLLVSALFAALLPASKAAKVDPIVALQDE